MYVPIRTDEDVLFLVWSCPHEISPKKRLSLYLKRYKPSVIQRMIPKKPPCTKCVNNGREARKFMYKMWRIKEDNKRKLKQWGL